MGASAIAIGNRGGRCRETGAYEPYWASTSSSCRDLVFEIADGIATEADAVAASPVVFCGMLSGDVLFGRGVFSCVVSPGAVAGVKATRAGCERVWSF